MGADYLSEAVGCGLWGIKSCGISKYDPEITTLTTNSQMLFEIVRIEYAVFPATQCYATRGSVAAN